MKQANRSLSLRGMRLLWMLGAVLLAGWAALPARAATSAVSRTLEPVVVSNVFSGAPVDEVFVYTYSAGDGWKQIVHQVDERNAVGAYVASEDGVMDANDEVVFMSGDLGSMATPATWITKTVTSVDPTTIYEVAVTNPLNPAEKGYAYLVRSSTLAPDGSLTPYMQGFNEADQVITAQNYVIGWAEDFGGLDYLALFGGPDILDRTKLRAEISAFGQTQTLTEDAIDTQDVSLDKAGPVRVIVHVVPSDPRLENVISTTTLAYASYIETITRIDASAVPSAATLKSVRLSTDLLPSASGAIYYDENTAAGVTIDGSPDNVAATPFADGWRQVSLDSGATVQVFSIEGDLQAGKQHFYQDDTSPDNDTGDGMAYGDSGLLLTNPQGGVFAINSAQYFLPNKQGNVGAVWSGNSQQPLVVGVADKGDKGDLTAIYLPLLLQPTPGQ